MLFQLKAFSAVFVVTSNADSGPGTLRDALTKAAANGSTEKDYINFNLPDLSEAGRTITISTKLPNVSSNLVIDGTTQPGVAFGVSNSKIILQPDVVSNNFNAFTLLNVNGFELYGLYVRDFIGKFYYKLLGNSENTLASALYSEASKNIQIGAVGKGNVFTNNEWVIKTPYAPMVTQQPSPDGVENLKVFANFLGIEPDGKTQRTNVNGYSTVGLDITDCKGDIEIGGDDVSLRNYFGYFSSCVVQEGNGQASAYTSLINIKNNYFNYDVNGQAIAILSPSLYTYMFSFINHPSNEYLNYPYTYNFIGNKILFPLMTLIYPVGGDITFQGNDELASPFDPGLGKKG